jgi:hypothetical protein
VVRRAQDPATGEEACRRVVVAGDTLIDRGNGLEVHPAWPVQAVAVEEVIHRLRPLLDLPVDAMLPTHADPADRAAVERAPVLSNGRSR